ncbi:exodeoxyribonuclease VII large subunit [Clostridium algidicarnis]|uniref:exodeoxyribonuclease VII large subunit n=1 Tax=Clostridium algidicarnis TaxID=37659 RepID=UPI0016269E93|nr:exodeoxyribonuclease VII large subunit [Clostridium algidicarnis]MBB6697598.1 exodeoxyribonuclease VII large subunit [Clostridium algidicarnis]MBU3203314.1 exodeoxyribonuclease VII large subunit [Clostridium algidicarnis]MBU3211468.1 exodeoxyribonuclease VII large subunit [Clostridium algidicarnis]MBU3222024.1 exodeoxyribonuclease VII large subunit [Clostridium algidicarnis]
MYIKTLTVTLVNSYVKKMLDNDIILNNLKIKGEVSNFKKHSSGHLYFSLKDDSSKINCVMFKDYASLLDINMEDGLMVEIKGKIKVYQKEGSYQLYCEEIKKQGVGELYLAFLKLKETLEKEGLFKLEHKKPLPLYPKKIGVITSPTGAAIKDVINVAKRRNPYIDIIIYPALVQGIGSSSNVIRGIEYLEKDKKVEVIIIARGGGSIEELWSFNDEALARRIYESKTPIVTGVGHETDYTIVDFVSDLRAPTPSAAAEIVFKNHSEIKKEVDYNYNRLQKSMEDNLLRKKNEVNLLKNTIEFNSPMTYILNEHKKIEIINDRLNISMKKKVSEEKNKLGYMLELLNSRNPLNILNKGYTLVKDESGKIVKDSKKLSGEQQIEIKFRDGSLKAKIESK